MKQTKLIQLLKSLTKREFRRLRKFLLSPFFNANQTIIVLYDYLRKYYPDFNHPKLQKEIVFSKIYPEETFNVYKINLLISDFKLLVDEYLVQLQLKNQELEHKRLWFAALAARNLNHTYQNNAKKWIKTLNESNKHDATNFKNLQELNHQLLDYGAANQNPVATIDLLFLANQNLDLAYLTLKWQYICSLASYNKFLKASKVLPFTDQVLSVFKKNEAYNEYPFFKIFQYLLELIQTGHSLETYLELKALVHKHHKEFPIEIQNNILKLLLNHCAQIYKLGDISFLEEQFSWYQFGLRGKIITPQKQLTDASYINIIIMGSFLKKNDWTSNFIYEYNAYLDTTLQENAKCLGLAYFHFHQAEWVKTIDYLQKIDFSINIFYNLRGRVLLLRCYMELYIINKDNPEHIYYQAAAFKRYLTRNKALGNSTVNAYLNFIKLILKLLDYKTSNKSKDELLDIEKEINPKKDLVLKPWLMKILNAL